MGKTIETHIQKRFSDIDRMGHVNNARQVDFLDLGKSDYFSRVVAHEAQSEFETVTPVIAAIKVDFVAQIRYEEDVWVRTRVERIGRKSLTLRQQLFVRQASGDTEIVCTEAETVMVAYNRTTGEAVEVPQAWRDRIENRQD
jgi:acyl-CoA thioester hydrolase